MNRHWGEILVILPFCMMLEAGCGNSTVTDASELSTGNPDQIDIDAALPGIVCWGDSLTSGYLGEGVNYPDELENLIDERLIDPLRRKSGNESLKAPEVVNLGVAAETTLEIAGRNGGIPLMAAEDFLIPAKVQEVDFEYCSSERNSNTKLLRDGDGGVRTVTVDGIEGALIRWYDTEADHSRYKFRRLTEGQAVRVNKGDLIVTNLYDEYLDYIPIIMMGGNGDWTDLTDLEDEFQAMIDHSNCGDRFVIAARPLNDETDMTLIQQEDDEMSAHFGSRAVSLRQWMIDHGLETAGIDPSAEDLDRMNGGQIPSSLMNEDLIHFTPEGYRAMAEMFYQKMDELGYFDGLKALAE